MISAAFSVIEREIGIEVIGSESCCRGVLKDGKNGCGAVVASGPIGIKEEESVAAVLLEREETGGERIGSVVGGGGVTKEIAVIKDVSTRAGGEVGDDEGLRMD